MLFPKKIPIQLHAPFSPHSDAQHLVKPTAALAKTTVSSNLLQRRMGHRSIQALGIDSLSNMLEDTVLTPDEDSFCWGREITVSRKANCGKINLKANNDLKPGSCLILHWQKNTSKMG